MIEPKLMLVHMQIIKRRNLRCYFCGQWGENGFLRQTKTTGREMGAAEWCLMVDSVANHAGKSGIMPGVMIWGGEPFMHEGVDDILRRLHANNIPTSLVTNGVLLGSHIDTVNECVDELFVSVDGPEELHEKTRGVKGIYKTIMSNAERIDTSQANTVCMCTINELNRNIIESFPHELARHNFKSVLYQNLIFLSPRDAECYEEWTHATFGIQANHARAWVNKDFGSYVDELPQIFARMENLIEHKKYPIEVKIFPPEVNSRTVRDYYHHVDGVPADKKGDNYCWTPFRHINISCEGDVHPCIDFDDVVLGNVRENSLEEIFLGPAFRKFRQQITQDKNPACKRCPWKYNKFTYDSAYALQNMKE